MGDDEKQQRWRVTTAVVIEFVHEFSCCSAELDERVKKLVFGVHVAEQRYDPEVILVQSIDDVQA